MIDTDKYEGHTEDIERWQMMARSLPAWTNDKDEQLVRDARIAPIYEGTNGIQALDLVGRKLPQDMGRPFKKFSEKITDHIRSNKDNEKMVFILPIDITHGSKSRISDT